MFGFASVHPLIWRTDAFFKRNEGIKRGLSSLLKHKMSRSLRVLDLFSKTRARAPHIDIETCSKKAQMFIFEISCRLVCGQPCGAMPYMKGNVGFECRSTNRPVTHTHSPGRDMQGVKCKYDMNHDVMIV